MRRNRKHTFHPEAARFRYLRHGKALRPYPAQVFKQYYGLTGEPPMTMREIAKGRGVSVGRVQQLRREAESVLHRQALRERGLREADIDRLYYRWWRRENMRRSEASALLETLRS